MQDQAEVTDKELAEFYPLGSLDRALLRQLTRESHYRVEQNGATLFNESEEDDLRWYLLSGNVQCAYSDGREKQLKSGTSSARYPIGDFSPRRFTATVVSKTAQLITIPRGLCEKIISFSQIAQQHVDDGSKPIYDKSEESARWVVRMLKSKAFTALPTGSFDRLLSKFEEYPVQAGQVVIREGDVGDYFYVIREGTAAVTKMQDDDEATVAYLARGDSFGEDALISQNVRNATVTMKKTGTLLRLGKSDFSELMKAPMIKWLTPGQASIKVRQGARVVDVRLPAEFEQRCIKGAKNAPLHELRESVLKWDKTKPTVLYCNTGERSGCAAYILSKLGFTEPYAIQGGLTAMLKMLQKAGGA